MTNYKQLKTENKKERKTYYDDTILIYQFDINAILNDKKNVWCNYMYNENVVIDGNKYFEYVFIEKDVENLKQAYILKLRLKKKIPNLDVNLRVVAQNKLVSYLKGLISKDLIEPDLIRKENTILLQEI